MASDAKSRRWILLGLLALGIVLAATLPRRGSEEPEEESDTESAEASPTSGDQTPRTAQVQDTDGGMASRRIAENCDPTEESLKYEEFIGRRALAMLSWNGLSERAANLKIPVHVAGIEDGAVGVRFMQFPMREQYLGIWLGSGHIKPGPNDVFLLDPCSATIVAWTEMEHAGASGDEDDEDDSWLDDEDDADGGADVGSGNQNFGDPVEEVRKRL